MTRRLLATAGILIAGTVLLTGCGAIGAGPAGPQPQPDDSVGMPQEQVADGSDPGTDASAPQVADEDRAVIVSGSVAMRAADPLETADAVRDAAQARGGTIDRRSEGASTDFEPAWASLTVRVPATEVDGMLDALQGLAEVTTLDLTERVVTSEVRDLEVRVDAARASVDRLTEQLSTAADTDILLRVEEQLTQRTGELESLLAEQRALAEQVSMSTLDVQISSTTVEGPTGTPSFWDGLVAGWQGFLAWGATVLFGLGQSMPALLILAALALAAWLVIRRVTKRMRLRPAATRPTTAAAEVANPVGTAAD